MKPHHSRSEDRQRFRKPGLGPKKFSPTKLRIVAGNLRNSKIGYNGDPVTRPMKERTREAVFSLLGGYLDGAHVLDLFGGTGILAFESVSRGAHSAVVLELARPAIKSMLENMKALQLENRVEVQNVDTLRWLRNLESQTRAWPRSPWVVFCCPPYRMWTNEQERLVAGIESLYERCPVGSKFVCETDKTFDLPAQTTTIQWDVRKYPPAIISIAQKHASIDANKNQWEEQK